MFPSTLYLTVLAASLSVCWAKPADIVARVPSSYYGGTKWVLFRDNSIPDPPPNVIVTEDNVQVLPTYRYQNQQHQTVSVSPAPVRVQATPVHFIGNFDTTVVQKQHLQPIQPHYNFHGDFQKFVQLHQQHQKPILKVTTFGVTPVPHTSVHVDGPTYVDFLRKKKSA